MSKKDIARCRWYVNEMLISLNDQGYVIGNIETGVTVSGKPSTMLCKESDGLSNSFWVSGFQKEAANKIINEFSNENFSIYYKTTWYTKRAEHLEEIYGKCNDVLPSWNSRNEYRRPQYLRDLDDMYEKYGGHGA